MATEKSRPCKLHVPPCIAAVFRLGLYGNRKKKILQVPPVTSFLNTSCTFSSNSKQKQEPRELTSNLEAQTSRGPGPDGMSAIASKFCQAPALPSSFRGQAYAQASPICIQWGLFGRTRERNRLLCKHNRLPLAGRGRPQRG